MIRLARFRLVFFPPTPQVNGTWRVRGSGEWKLRLFLLALHTSPSPSSFQPSPCSFRVSFASIRLGPLARRLRTLERAVNVSAPLAASERYVQQMELSIGDRALELIGWLGGFYSRKSVLSRSALEIYKNCIDQLNYEAFFKACNMPDTLQSWFLVAQLHIWLCMVRLKREGKDGAYVTRQVVATFWLDVKERANALGVHSSSIVHRSIQEMTAEFYGLTIAYEEGLLLDDKVLAAAVWRNLIPNKSSADPVHIECVIQYIRSQVLHMDHIDTNILLKKGKISLLPFNPLTLL